MRYELRIPRTSDGSLAVTVLSWLKKVGEPVKKGEDLVEAKTEKDYPIYHRPADGHISEVLVTAGKAAGVGDLIGYLEE